MYTNIYKKASDMVNAQEEATVAVIRQDGFPHAATRSNLGTNGIMSRYFTSDTSGNMITAIKNNSKVSVCYLVGSDNITLMGTCELVEDMAIKKSLWIDWFINHYPGGPEDPEYTVVKFTTEKVSMWVDREVIKFDISEITEQTSYCGLMCNNCEWKEPNNCKGCVASGGNPFYGSCPIAACAKSRDLAHCGECDALPCDLMKEYSCGESEHADNPKGARIDVVKMWANVGGI